MSEALLIAAFLLVAGAIGRVYQLLSRHIEKCNQEAIHNAHERGRHEAVINRILEDIGDGDSGIRGNIHQLRRDISPYIVLEQHRRGE